jgi:hypothetical protein
MMKDPIKPNAKSRESGNISSNNTLLIGIIVVLIILLAVAGFLLVSPQGFIWKTSPSQTVENEFCAELISLKLIGDDLTCQSEITKLFTSDLESKWQLVKNYRASSNFYALITLPLDREYPSLNTLFNKPAVTMDSLLKRAEYLDAAAKQSNSFLNVKNNEELIRNGNPCKDDPQCDLAYQVVKFSIENMPRENSFIAQSPFKFLNENTEKQARFLLELLEQIKGYYTSSEGMNNDCDWVKRERFWEDMQYFFSSSRENSGNYPLQQALIPLFCDAG